MLLRISVENYKSFDQKEELSLISSSKIQNNKSHRVRVKQTNILKNAVIYGANASGKSNLVKMISFVKNTLIDGLSMNSFDDFCKNCLENKERESIFELQFTVDDKFYAYGFSAILSQRIITEEWLYELMQDGSAHKLFIREKDKVPALGENISLNTFEKNRFLVYAEDFVGHDTQLFLSEMNRGKKYEDNSKLFFFKKIFDYLINNIIVINPVICICLLKVLSISEKISLGIIWLISSKVIFLVLISLTPVSNVLIKALMFSRDSSL